MTVKTYYCRNKTVNFTQHLTIENVFVRRQTHTERERGEQLAGHTRQRPPLSTFVYYLLLHPKSIYIYISLQLKKEKKKKEIMQPSKMMRCKQKFNVEERRNLQRLFFLILVCSFKTSSPTLPPLPPPSFQYLRE